MAAKLYCFGESGNAYKAALTMTMAGHDWQPVYVDFFGGETRTEAFRKINAMGECPVLVEGDLTLTQSGVIQLHVAEATGRFTPDAETLRWLFWDNHKGSGQFGALRFLRNFLPEDKRPAGALPFLQARADAALATLEAHLAGREWMVGTAPGLADFACCGYLHYPEPFGYAADTHPNIAAWLERLRALPGWKHPYDMMPGNPSDRA